MSKVHQKQTKSNSAEPKHENDAPAESGVHRVAAKVEQEAPHAKPWTEKYPYPDLGDEYQRAEAIVMSHGRLFPGLGNDIHKSTLGELLPGLFNSWVRDVPEDILESAVLSLKDDLYMVYTAITNDGADTEVDMIARVLQRAEFRMTVALELQRRFDMHAEAGKAVAK